MKAALFREFQGPITVETVPDPAPTRTGVVIRVEATGICRSDWHGWMGHDPDVHLPHVPGHEFAGIIEATGKAVTSWKPGDRVTAPFVCGCGNCSFCEAGDQQVCPHQFQPGFTAWGSFAPFVMVEHAEENLVRLPDELDFRDSASLGCRLATAYRAVVHQARIRAGDWIAIHGCGGVGLSAIMIAKALGARPIAIDIEPAKLLRARQLGALDTVDASSEDVPSAIIDLTSGGARSSIDALGSSITAKNSINCLRPRGRHIQIGLMTGEDSLSPIPFDRVVAKELELYGSHGMQAHNYHELFSLICQGSLDPGQLISRTITLEEAPMALTTQSAFQETGIVVADRIT